MVFEFDLSRSLDCEDFDHVASVLEQETESVESAVFSTSAVVTQIVEVIKPEGRVPRMRRRSLTGGCVALIPPYNYESQEEIEKRIIIRGSHDLRKVSEDSSKNDADNSVKTNPIRRVLTCGQLNRIGEVNTHTEIKPVIESKDLGEALDKQSISELNESAHERVGYSRSASTALRKLLVSEPSYNASRQAKDIDRSIMNVTAFALYLAVMIWYVNTIGGFSSLFEF